MGRPLLYDEVPVGQCKVRAIFSWSGETKEDLGFVEGDIIEVLNTGDGDWWTGRLRRNRMVGHFPRNFAVYVDENQETMSAAAHSKATKGSKYEAHSLDADYIGNNSNVLADLQIGDPIEKSTAPEMPSALGHSSGSAGLGASANSQRSTKSAEEILKDIGEELNRGYLDDVNIKSQPEELFSPELGLDDSADWGKLDGAPGIPERHSVATDDAPPPVPPHKISPAASLSRRSQQGSLQQRSSIDPALSNSSANSLSHIPEPKSSALTGPVLRVEAEKPEVNATSVDFYDPQSLDPRAALDPGLPHGANSPSLHEEVPFDPRAFQPEKPIGNHIGSHLDIDTPTYGAGSAMNEEKPMAVSKTRPSHAANKNTQAAKKQDDFSSNVVMFPVGNDDEADKNRFFEKLFPKNSKTRLRRSTSHTSQKSSKSSRSARSYHAIKSRLRGIKSIFSFAPSMKVDEDIYPSNAFTRSEPQTTDALGLGPVQNHSIHDVRGIGGVAGLSTVTQPPLGSSTTANPSLEAREKSLGGKWIQNRRDLYRAKTLTERDIVKRRRAMELQGINCDDLIASLNDQAGNDFHDYRLESFTEVDNEVLTMTNWPQLMTPAVFASSRIGRKFSDPVERVRAVFLICATHISHVQQTEPGNNVMQSRRATPLELAQTVAAMVSALDVECLVIEGHLRTAKFGSQTIESVEHAWNSVKIEGEWRFLDSFSAASGSSILSRSHPQEADVTADSVVDGEESINLFYFLTPPMQLIFTHVPADQKFQFLKPSLPTATAAILPVASPAAFAHGISFSKFWLGMTRLSDLDMSELSLNVPNGSTDLAAFVNSDHALAQAYTDEGGRKVRVKAFVPHGRKQALLQIFALNKLQPAAEPTDMELLWTLELRHVSGESNNAPYEFVRKFASPQQVNSDLYVVEPQCRMLGGGDLYTFRVEHFPASADLVKQPQLAIQSPSGRITKLVPFGTDLNDTFKASVKTLEVGTWRGVSRSEESESWVPFAEWFCE